MTGTAEVGSTVSVTVGVETLSAVAVDGNWSVDFSAAGLEDGELSVSAVAQDAAGNTSAPATASLSLDTTAPDDPVIAVQTSLGVSGSGEPGAVVLATNETTNITESSVIGTGGDWNIVFAAAPAPGDQITISIRDLSGNESNSVVTTTPATDGWLAGVDTLTYDRPLASLGDEHFEGMIPNYVAGMTLQLEIVDARGLGGAAAFNTQIAADGKFTIEGRDGLLSDVIDGAINTLGLDAGDSISLSLTVIAQDGAKSPTGMFLLRDPEGVVGGLTDLLGGEILGISRNVPRVGQRYTGTDEVDHMTGEEGLADILEGLGGDDLLGGIAAGDSAFGGDGDDVLMGLAGFTVVDGGGGNDRLVMTGDLALIADGDSVTGIEILDFLQDTGANTLSVDSSGLAGLGNLAAELTVLGDAGDEVVLSDSFGETGTRREGESGSQLSYTDSAGNSLWIDDDITVTPMSS